MSIGRSDSSSAPCPAMEIAGLCAGYADHAVLHDVHMTVQAGEFVGLVGPNGAGKSTLLKTASGVITPTSGSVRILGRTVADYGARELARKLAYVPQSEPVLFDFTVREVVLMGRHPHQRRDRDPSRSDDSRQPRPMEPSGTQRASGGADTDHSITAHAMAVTDVLHLADRPVTALSGGEHRRVILARAIAQTPTIMLLDEPTAHLDIAHQSEVLRLISDMARSEGLCAVAALHDLNVAAEWCDRLVLMANGRILADGPPSAVLAAPCLTEAYGIPFQLATNPITGRAFVAPVVRRKGEAAPDAPRIHIICGGGTGAGIMAELARAGYRLSAGVLNRLDTDEGAAEAYGIPTATVEPFSPISEAAYQQAVELAADASFVVIAPIPIGHGNLRNLELARALADRGARIAMVNDPPIEARDFTDGMGARMWADLEARSDTLVLEGSSVTAALHRGLTPTALE